MNIKSGIMILKKGLLLGHQNIHMSDYINFFVIILSQMPIFAVITNIPVTISGF